MDANDRFLRIKIRKKPWYVWLLRFVWLAWVIFLAEVAWGSWKELEPRAAVIALGILLFSLAVGIFFWLWGRKKAKKMPTSLTS